MHLEAEEFIRKNAHHITWLGADVVEVGSYNVNGTARDFIAPEIGGGAWASWTGVDLLAGPGVDFVGDACELLPRMCDSSYFKVFPVIGPYDVIVTTEALEHYPDWKRLLWETVAALKRGGYLMLTCAGTGRTPHAADGSGPPRPGEHYANVSLADVMSALGSRVEMICGSELFPPGDTRLIARKP